MKFSISRILAIAPLFLGLALLSGCQEKGPVEKAGANIDKAASNAADAVNPKGPGEKVGEKVDDATPGR